MATGRLGRSTARYPATRRRMKHYAASRYGKRGRGLPPNLMPGVQNRSNPETLFSRRNFLIASFVLFVWAALTVAVASIASAVAAAFGTVREYKKVNGSLPDATRIFVNTFQTTRIFARDGSLLQELEHPDYGWRTYINFDQMPDDFVNATISAEDSTFWTNQGVEPLAFVRAGVIMFTGAGSSGGSTITQQLVRAMYPTQISKDDRSVNRKFREALAAYAMNKEYSKQDIFTMYVNQIFYGFRSYGIEAAANTLFSKHAKELNLAECSLLAGLPQSPTTYNPTTPEGFEIAKRRQRYVLDQMVKYRYITKEQADTAFNEPLNITNDRNSLMKAAPHFMGYVQDYVVRHYGDDALYAGLQIYTSLDLALQADAEKMVKTGVQRMKQYNRNNGALVAIVPWSGEVLCMVGSADFNDAAIGGQVNYATSRIQPGSSMKPIAYATAFGKGWNPGTVVLDVPSKWPTGTGTDYTPLNYTKQFYGAVSVRMALANSFNIGAVKATEFAGVENVMKTARRMGLERSLNQDAGFYGVSLGLGSGEVMLLEHTNAYATFANMGKHIPATPITKVTDSQGNVLRESNKATSDKLATQAIEAGVAYQITSILTDNKSRARMFTEDNLFGNTQKQLNRPTAAKSGTTENWNDLWTMGYTSDVAVGVWVGRSGDTSNVQLNEIDGIEAAGPIWQDMMLALHQNDAYKKLLLGPDGHEIAKDFPVPSDVHQIELCKITGHLPGDGETIKEWVVKGREPKLRCNEMDDYEKEQLKKARENTRGEVNWASDGLSTFNRYLSEVGGGSNGSDSSSDSNSQDSNNQDSNSQDSNTDNQPVIEPIGN